MLGVLLLLVRQKQIAFRAGYQETPLPLRHTLEYVRQKQFPRITKGRGLVAAYGGVSARHLLAWRCGGDGLNPSGLAKDHQDDSVTDVWASRRV